MPSAYIRGSAFDRQLGKSLIYIFASMVGARAGTDLEQRNAGIAENLPPVPATKRDGQL